MKLILENTGTSCPRGLFSLYRDMFAQCRVEIDFRQMFDKSGPRGWLTIKSITQSHIKLQHVQALSIT